MRTLVLAHMFPHEHNETIGLSTFRRTVELAKRCPVMVVSPTSRRDLPEHEVLGGLDVFRPRWRRIPKIGVFTDGYTYGAAVARVLPRIRGSFDFDVIDSHWLYPDGFAATRLGRELRRPVVLTGRGSDVDVLCFHWAVRRRARRALQAATRLCALSRAMRDTMVQAGADGERIDVVPNGVDTERFCPGDRDAARQELGQPADGTLLFSCGYMTRDKGFHHLIEGLPSLPDDVRLAMAGFGEEEDALERLASERGVADRVTFLGRVAQAAMPLWYRAADFFCFATYHEGCPNTVLEALACGTPVVSTNVGGVPDLMDGEGLGVLCEPRDTQAFVDALGSALERTWDRAAIAAHGQKRSWANVAAECYGVLERAMVTWNQPHTA